MAAPFSPAPPRPASRLRPAPAQRRWILWAALLPTLAAVLLFGAVRPAVNAGLELALYAGTALVFLRCWRKPEFLPTPWILAPMAGFALFVLAQWSFRWTVYPAVTLNGLAQLCAYGCVFYLGLIAFTDARNVRLAARLLTVFAALVAAEAIVQKYTTGGMIYGLRDATMDALPIGPFTYHNFFAAFIELLLPLALVVGFSRLRGLDWSVQLRRILAPALMLAAFFVAASRGGAMILGVELVLGAILLWRARRRLGRRRGMLALTAGVLVAFTLLAGWGPMMRRFSTVSHDSSASDRVQFSLSCLEIWRAHPWVGTGLNTFSEVYPKYRRFENGLLLLYAHDDVAQLLAETGALGFALALAVAALAIYGIRSRLRHTLEPELVRYKLAAMIGGIGFAVHCCGDFVSHCPALSYLFWLLLAYMLAAVTPGHIRRRSKAPMRLQAMDGAE
ncbi:MAG: O-antigen ligase family protein [Terriglobales bacterium]